MAKLSRWLRYCSRRAQPSGHKADEETQADRVAGVVVAKHNGRAAGLSGDMEGPSVHQVHVGRRGCTVQCDADLLLTAPANVLDAPRTRIAKRPAPSQKHVGVVSADAPLRALSVDVHPS